MTNNIISFISKLYTFSLLDFTHSTFNLPTLTILLLTKNRPLSIIIFRGINY